MTNETAPERCEYCRRSIWADQEQELFVDAEGEADCFAAPKVYPAGPKWPLPGCHEPA